MFEKIVSLNQDINEIYKIYRKFFKNQCAEYFFRINKKIAQSNIMLYTIFFLSFKIEK